MCVCVCVHACVIVGHNDCRAGGQLMYSNIEVLLSNITLGIMRLFCEVVTSATIWNSEHGPQKAHIKQSLQPLPCIKYIAIRAHVCVFVGLINGRGKMGRQI